MTTRTFVLLFFCVLFSTVLPTPSIRADDGQRQDVADISNEEFSKLHKGLVPKMALWKTVPWQTSLLKAQNLAVKESKPIFIWSMDGHPLGCT